MTDLDQLKYPIGPMPRLREPLDPAVRRQHLEIIESAPARIRALVTGLREEQLGASYRPGGWTIRQIVHHLADSHMNAYVRMKLAATEELPAVKTWEPDRWADLPDARRGAVDASLALVEALHRRWIAFLRELSDADVRKAFRHPEWGDVSIEESIAMYSWHCRHHAAHIERALGSDGAR